MLEADQTHSLPRENLEARDPVSRKPSGRSRASGLTFANGQMVLGRFRILSLLGAGGMGEVYEAEDLQLGCIVALKTIRGEITGDSVLLSRFCQEVHLARRVSHTNVCRIHELFTIESRIGGTPPTLFLSMEFLDGVTLADKLQKDGPYSWREAEVIVRSICHGLDAIHAAGIVHRDLKCRNIMLVEKDGKCRVVLTDFGLAIDAPSPQANGHPAPFTVEKAAVLAGTPDYMAPEQFECRPVSPATDIYALGIVLYELVTAHQPFASDTPDVAAGPIGAAARRARRPARASALRAHIPHGWDTVIYRCLEYEPARRYQSANEVAKALHLHRTALGSLWVRTARLARRPLGWSIAAVLLLAVGASIWYWRSQHEYHHPSAEVEGWYQKGLTAIREGTYVKATLALQMAVDKDPRYAMAHARLAEAWSELDFTGKADQEMLQASTLELQQHLPELDAAYIHAVRDTLTHDYEGAVYEYRAILRSVPEKDKADAYVDLGRAQEKRGKIPEALEDYEIASRLARDAPAAFLHVAILQSRLQKRKEAEAAFESADALYRTGVNEEGLAEVTYQRGYAANDRGDTVEAEKYLKESIELAKHIPSVQMEIRALTQLSDITSEVGDDKNAVDDAERAIELARKNGLTYWQAIGLVRLGGAYLGAADTAKRDLAEQPLEEAIQIAHDYHHPRAEAEAKLNMASLREQQHRPDDLIPLARDSWNIYIANGNLDSALDASTLLVRGQLIEGDFASALTASSDLLSLADKSGSLREKMQAEELKANVLRGLERYPDALDHYRTAIAASLAAPQKAEVQLKCVFALGALGLFSEANEMLTSIPPLPADDRTSDAVRAHFSLVQMKYPQVLTDANKALGNVPEDLSADLQIDMAAAELHLGRFASAEKRISDTLALSISRKDQPTEHQAKLVRVQLLLSNKSFTLARDLATELSAQFHASQQQESELFSLYYLALSQRQLGNLAAADDAAKKAVDIYLGWAQHWSPSLVSSYSSRPDVQAMLRDLQKFKVSR